MIVGIVHLQSFSGSHSDQLVIRRHECQPSPVRSAKNAIRRDRGRQLHSIVSAQRVTIYQVASQSDDTQIQLENSYSPALSEVNSWTAKAQSAGETDASRLRRANAL